jgi:hypothetical protein
MEEKVYEVVRQRAPNKELHGEIVDTFGILSFVRLLGVQPTLREDVADRAGDSLIALPWAYRCEVDHIVKQKMPLVKRVIGPSELNRTTPILPK